MAVVAATAVVEAAAVAAAARLASLLYRRSPVRGRSQACRAHLQRMVSSASQCPPYLMALPQEFLQTLSPWPARLLAICRNFPRAIWAPRHLNLIRGPLARNRWTRKSWNDSWTAFLCLFSVCLGRFSMANAVSVWLCTVYFKRLLFRSLCHILFKVKPVYHKCTCVCSVRDIHVGHLVVADGKTTKFSFIIIHSMICSPAGS